MNASTNTPACVNPEDDVIDRIDELVTESLSKPWDQISGYDNDINQESCGHCGRAWHGLPLAVRSIRHGNDYHGFTDRCRQGSSCADPGAAQDDSAQPRLPR